MRRMFMFALVAFLLLVFFVAALVAAVARAFQSAGPLGDVLIALALIGGFGLLVFAGRGVRRYARPIAELVEAVGRVAEGDLSTRVQERGPRAVRGLARAFNTMSARLESSEAQRRRLLADVSHELRSPLSVVQGNLEALIDGVHPADDEHLHAILDETKVLSRLIEDLGTLSVAEAGALALHREPTDLGAIARDVTESFRSQADAAGVRLERTTSPGLPAADADPVRVREILSNLVANGMRYTPAGGVVRIDTRSDGANVVAVTVTDTGRGIAADALAHVFDRFYKSAESRGAGLGLAIAKQLVVAHGGTITAESTLGVGTAIRFTLPAEADAH